MGLDINNYSYSYGRLHQLRQLALDYERQEIDIKEFYYLPNPQTKFNEFINHSDCEGIYVSKNSPKYEEYKQEILEGYGQLECYFGDLDKLKEELNELNPYVQERLKDSPLLQSWNDFYEDVMDEDEIVEFR